MELVSVSHWCFLKELLNFHIEVHKYWLILYVDVLGQSARDMTENMDFGENQENICRKHAAQAPHYMELRCERSFLPCKSSWGKQTLHRSIIRESAKVNSQVTPIAL